jgi:Kef-type K+ transport system membrane component KefB
MVVAEFFLLLAVILVAAKLMGELAERIGQPAVLGELLAGVILGTSVLGVVRHDEEIVHLLAELGVVILLFEIGLETDLKKLLAVGSAAFMVACVGVVLPFGLGFGVAVALGLSTIAALVAGAALTATSVGITARVLSDLGRLNDPEGQVVLGAAVIDDVIGLIILAVIARLVAGSSVSPVDVLASIGAAFGFLVIAVAMGRLLVPPLFTRLQRYGRESSLPLMGLVLALLFAVAAERAGSAMIVGAFAAGLVLQPTRQARAIEAGIVRLGHLFVPIFFVAVGAAVDVRSFGDAEVLILGLALLAVGIVGKVLAGYAPWWFKGRKIVIGVAMVPRGEVGLIFAQMGLAAGAVTAGQYSALMLMVMGTTFFAPPVLRALLGTGAPPDERVVPGSEQMVTEA